MQTRISMLATHPVEASNIGKGATTTEAALIVDRTLGDKQQTAHRQRANAQFLRALCGAPSKNSCPKGVAAATKNSAASRLKSSPKLR